MTLKVKIINVPWFDNDQLHFPGAIVELLQERHFSSACMEKLSGWPRDPYLPAKPEKKPTPVKAQLRRDRSRIATPKAVVVEAPPVRDEAMSEQVAEVGDANPSRTGEDVPCTTDVT